jgi:hypothetical protein
VKNEFDGSIFEIGNGITADEEPPVIVVQHEKVQGWRRVPPGVQREKVVPINSKTPDAVLKQLVGFNGAPKVVVIPEARE